MMHFFEMYFGHLIFHNFSRIFKKKLVVKMTLYPNKKLPWRNHPFFPDALLGHAHMPPLLWHPHMAIVTQRMDP
jgi:hypothetical protein